MRIVLSTTNRNKYLELSHLAKVFNLELILPEEIAQIKGLTAFPEVEETGLSYEENAALKAKICAAWCEEISLGDDSGLEVDILNGAPGLHSARYAPSDKEKINKLIGEIQALNGFSNAAPSARFISVLALYNPNTKNMTYSHGILEGVVLETPKGLNGFGYDPIIEISEFKQTLAELSPSFVAENGFRAKAAKELFTKIIAKDFN